MDTWVDKRQYITVKTCSVCGREFIPGSEHMYWISTKAGKKWQCRYSCYNEARKEKGWWKSHG